MKNLLRIALSILFLSQVTSAYAANATNYHRNIRPVFVEDEEKPVARKVLIAEPNAYQNFLGIGPALPADYKPTYPPKKTVAIELPTISNPPSEGSGSVPVNPVQPIIDNKADTIPASDEELMKAVKIISKGVYSGLVTILDSKSYKTITKFYDVNGNFVGEHRVPGDEPGVGEPGVETWWRIDAKGNLVFIMDNDLVDHKGTVGRIEIEPGTQEPKGGPITVSVPAEEMAMAVNILGKDVAKGIKFVQCYDKTKTVTLTKFYDVNDRYLGEHKVDSSLASDDPLGDFWQKVNATGDLEKIGQEPQKSDDRLMLPDDSNITPASIPASDEELMKAVKIISKGVYSGLVSILDSKSYKTITKFYDVNGNFIGEHRVPGDEPGVGEPGVETWWRIDAKGNLTLIMDNDLVDHKGTVGRIEIEPETQEPQKSDDRLMVPVGFKATMEEIIQKNDVLAESKGRANDRRIVGTMAGAEGKKENGHGSSTLRS